MTFEQLKTAYLVAKAETDRLRYTRDRDALRAAVLAEMAAWDAVLSFDPSGEHRRKEGR